MGRSLANVQVHVGDRPVAEVQVATIEAIRGLLQAEGFAPVAGVADADEPDRAVFVAPHASGRWVAVYDERVEFGTERTVCAWAAALSAATRGAALGVRVDDSDVLELFLFRAGVPADAFASDPDDPGLAEGADQWFGGYTGRPARWRDLLAAGATPARLRATWAARPVLAEDLLVAVAPLLGLDREMSWPGWQDARAAWLGPRQGWGEAAIPGLTRLAFRATRPAADSLGYPEAQGPPWLSYVDGTPYPVRAAVGDSLDDLYVVLTNSGGAARGLRVRLRGSALDRGLVEPARVRVVVGPRLQARPPEVHEAALIPARQGDATIYAATLPDVAIPAEMSEDATHVTWQQHQAAFLAKEIAVTVAATATAPGRGDLGISIAPIAQSEAETVPWPVELVVTPPEVPAAADRQGTPRE